METTVRIESIRVEGRYRKDLGDIEDLAKSIAKVGLLHAIVLTKDGQLVAGERRIAAVRQLGWQVIDARIVDNLTDAVALLEAERDENECRKPKTVSELVALAAALEQLEAERIALRKHDDAVRAGRIRQGTESPRGPEEPRGERARDIAGRAVGFAPTTYFKAKAVVGAAQDPALPADEKAAAEAALAEMDETGKVAPAYEKVRKGAAANPEPEKKPNGRNRKALPEAFRTAAYDLVKVAERLDRLVNDDRYSRNAEQVARMCRHDLLRANDLLAAVVDRVPQLTQEGN